MALGEQFEIGRDMQIRLLGHIEANVDERPVALGGSKQRAVLAMLGLEANRLISADRLIEGLWGEEPPPSAAKMVQTYVWRLRKLLADGGAGGEIVTRGRGYELQIDRELVDALRFERLVGEASRHGSGDAARQALALFRGEPLADIADEPFAGAEIRRLDELRLNAAELAIDADLAAGRHQEVVGEIEALLAGHPLRERFHAQRLLALYRSGRQSEALEAYREARATLVEAIGVEPAPELQALHAAILRQDPALTVDAPARELPAELERAAAPPLVGREPELRALSRLWRLSAAGDGALVTLVGAYGMGKSRIAAELAGEAHGEGATVLFASGAGPSEVALAAIARAAASRGPTLLVFDDADRAPLDVRVALRDLGGTARPLLVLAGGLQAAALARLEPRASVVLEPLGVEAVAAIAALYAPPGSEIPAAELLQTSRGVPRRVHEAAGEWSRRQATERVDALAGRTAAGRSEVRALEDELAGSVAELRVTLERLEQPPAADRVVCPYKGLASFESDDAEYFFGREGLVADLVAHLVGAQLLAVVGPSGSGKSSVVRAGLLPALAGGVLPGSQHWPQAVMRPGAHPGIPPGHDRGLLFVDQFEELFTTCANERERGEFVAALLRLPKAVIAVRADFYGRCAAYPGLARALAANQVLVGPMSREELRRAIERPAQRAGLVVDPELTTALVDDVDGEPGALPLLSTTLLELWSRREGQRLTVAANARSGGVHGAVARLAEDAYVALAPEQQAAARTLFLRLSDEDEGGAVVRRRIRLAEQDAAVVAELAARRLLTVSEGTVEVAHEALLHHWPRLRAWLDEDTEGRRLQHRLREAARGWEAEGRDPGALLRGARLAAALDWAARHEHELEPTERAFIDAGRRAGGAAQRRLRAGLAGVASLLVLAVAAGVLALHQRDQAIAGETDADAQRVGAQAVASNDLDVSLLLGRQAVALHDTPQTRGDLLAALLKSPAAVRVIRGVGEPATLALAPDGRTLVTMGSDRSLRFLDARTGRPVARTQVLPGDATQFALAPTGTRLVTGGDGAGLWNARATREIAPLPPYSFVSSAAFSRDGRTVFVIEAGPSTVLRRYDARTGAPIAGWRVLFAGPPGNGAGFDTVLAMPGARQVVTLVRGRLRVHDARTLAPLWTLDDPSLEHVAVSSDDRTLVLGRADGEVAFADVPSGTVRRVPAHHEAVVQVAVSPDGRTAASAGGENLILVWDVARRTVVQTLAGHSGAVTGLAFSRDGRTLYSSGLDGTIVVWDLTGARGTGGAFALPRAPAGLAVSPDGRTLAAAGAGGTISLIDAATLRRRTLRVSDGTLDGVAFIDDEHVLATEPRGYGRLIDTRTGRPGPRITGFDSAPRVDASGRRMALTWHGAAAVQSLAAGHPAGRRRFYRRSGGALSADISPDARTLAVRTKTGVEIVDVAGMRIRGFLFGSETASAPPRFLDGGRLVAVGSREGWVRLWSLATGRPVSPPLAAHQGAVAGLAVSPDGRTLASGGSDGFVRLFDLASRQPLSARLPVAPGSATTPDFSRDGAYLFATNASEHGYRWDMRPASWNRRACAIAGRRLTRVEWSEVLPGRRYDPAC